MTAMLVQLFRWCDRCFRIVTQGLTALHQGLWQGLLRPTDLDALTRTYYDQVSKYKNPEYNLAGLFEWERDVLAKHFPPGSHVLIAGAGGGREMIGLCRCGYQVDGFDCNDGCVRDGTRLLEQLGLDCRLMLAPPGALPEGLTTYDGVIVGWGAYMHIVGSIRRRAFLRQIRAVLRDGSPILLSFFVRTGTSRTQTCVVRLANAIRYLRGGERVEAGDWLSGSFDHHFTEEEIRSELRDAGFQMVAFTAIGHGVAVGLAASVPGAGRVQT